MTQTLTLQIPAEMAEAISIAAHSEDATLGEIIRDAIWRDMRRRTTLKQVETMQTKAFDSLRNLLQADFERALNWQHLQSRLLDKGYRLLQGRGDLIVHRASGERICRIADLQQDQSALTQRFQAPFGAHFDTESPQALAS